MNILILGGTGRLGSFLSKYLHSLGHTILAPTHQELDVLSSQSIKTFNKQYEQYEAAFIINCIGFTNVVEADYRWPEVYSLNSDLSWLLNILPSHWRYRPRFKDIPIYHISTDYVYDGWTSNSKETDLMKPFNKYGESKALGDAFLLSQNREIIIFRTSFKIHPWPYPYAFDNIKTNADYLDIIGPILGNLMLRLHQHEGNYRIINVGTKPKTVYELAVQRSGTKVKPHYDIHPGSILAPDVTMDLSRYREISSCIGHDKDNWNNNL